MNRGAHVYRQQLTLVLIDVLVFLTAFVAAVQLRFSFLRDRFPRLLKPGDAPWEPMLSALPIVLALWLVVLFATGAYRIHRSHLIFEFGRLVNAWLIVSGILLSASFFYRETSYSRVLAGSFLVFLLTLGFLGRLAARTIRRRIEGADAYRNRVLLIGTSSVSTHLAERQNGHNLSVVGILDDEHPAGTVTAGSLKVLGSTSQLLSVVKGEKIQRVIVSDPRMHPSKQLELLEVCIGANVEWQVVPSAYELMLDHYQMDTLEGIPLLGLKRCNIRGLNRIFKRSFDVITTSLGLTIISPLLLAVAALVKLTSKGPIFFSHERIGENGQPFKLYKFRSMCTGNDDTIHREYAKRLIQGGEAHQEDGKGALYKIKNDPRLTPIGEFLRRFSIDELPQLFNVLRGDMSLIGPRPPIPYEVEAYRQWHKRRFEGPPGITGLWQVSGRNRLSFEEMIKLDIEYLENWSFARDLKILFRTMGVLLAGRGY